MHTLAVPQGTYYLSRYPHRRREQLRAWDAADELILHWLAENVAFQNSARVLIVNDSFGALSTVLASNKFKLESGQLTSEKSKLLSLSDSVLSQKGILMNFSENKISADSLQLSSLLDLAESTSSQKMDLVVIKVPKSLAQLEEQLHCLHQWIGPKTKVISGGMVKSIHRSTLNLFETLIGPTETSLAKKKARLIFSNVDTLLKVSKNPFPKGYRLGADITGVEEEARLLSHGGVFSYAGLDMGSRFLLENLPLGRGSSQILDLGCGNGVLGIVAALRNPQAALTFVDESYLAIHSAQKSAQETLGAERASRMRFHAANCLDGIDEHSQDLIINNPPFHQQGSQSDQISLDMFKGAHRALKKGGALWVVGNRHLGYHNKLKRIFGNCQVVKGNAKFVVLSAQKS